MFFQDFKNYRVELSNAGASGQAIIIGIHWNLDTSELYVFFTSLVRKHCNL